MREHEHATPPLFQDESVIAVDKGAGVPVIPARNEGDDCLRTRVERSRGESLWVVHRIDRDTSGVVLFARTKEAHRALSIAFERREVEKRYVAFVRSDERMPAGERRITTPLHQARKGKMRPALAAEQGALASETLLSFGEAIRCPLGWVARVDARPKTGRQHQIRVHLRSISAPLLVDALYGGASSRDAGALGEGSPELTRLTLHAASIQFVHPVSKQLVVVESPLATDLAALDHWLRRSQS